MMIDLFHRSVLETVLREGTECTCIGFLLCVFKTTHFTLALSTSRSRASSDEAE